MLVQFAGTHLYTQMERGTVRVKCLAQEHNTMSPARTRTQTTWSGVKHINHEATVPLHASTIKLIHWGIQRGTCTVKCSRLKPQFPLSGLFYSYLESVGKKKKQNWVWFVSEEVFIFQRQLWAVARNACAPNRGQTHDLWPTTCTRTL